MSNFVGCIEGRSAGALMLEAQRLHSPAVDCTTENPSLSLILVSSALKLHVIGSLQDKSRPHENLHHGPQGTLVCK